MISYPSSFQSSRISDKQNANPNQIRIRPCIGSSPLIKQKIVQSFSNKSQDFQSIYRTINENQNKIQGSHVSMKTLLNNFCSTIEQSQQIGQAQSFRSLVCKILNKKSPTRKQIIQFCQQHNLVDKQDLLNKKQLKKSLEHKNQNNLKQILATDLGHLLIEDLCECLNKGNNISKQQEKIVEFLVPSMDDQISSSVLLQNYQIFKEELQSEQAERKKLALQFRIIHRNKIQTKLWSDHFRLQISKSLNFRQEKQRISYQSLCKCLGNILNQNEICVVFRHIYALQTNMIMPILDTSKTISNKFLVANLLRQGDAEIEQVNLQEKNLYFQLQQSHKRIKKLEKEKTQQMQILTNKDKEIDRLNRIIDFLQIQKQQNERINKSIMESQLQACKNKYEKRIEELLSNNKEQLRLTQWYQTQLQAIMQAVNKQSTFQKFLH